MDPATAAAHETPAPTGRSASLIIAGGVLLGTLLGIYVALTAMGKLDAINQDWDAVFHANAIQFILETGDADPSSLRAVNDAVGDAFFYPNAFHALTAVVGAISGASIPALLGAQSVLMAGLAGLGLAALVWRYTRRVAFAAVVPILLAMFAAFPTDVLWRGPLLPYAAGIALIPAFILLFGDALRTRQAGILLVGALAAAGLLGLHPSAALTAAIFAVAYVIGRWIAHRRVIRQDLWPALAVAALTVVVAPRFVFATLGAGGVATEAQVNWPAVESPGQAVGDLLFLNHAAAFPQYWLLLPILIGLVRIKKIPQLWWWLSASSVFVVLFVLAAAYDSPLTEQLTLPWWNDRWRLAAIVTLGLAVLAGHGLVLAADTIVTVLRRQKVAKRLPVQRLAAAVIILMMLGIGVLSEGFYSSTNGDRMRQAFGDGPTVSSAEQEAMQALAEMTGPDDRVMNDPDDGSPWMWALVDVQPIFGHVVNPSAIPGLSEDRQLLLSSFSCLDSDPAVREVIEEFDITYVFLGQGYVRSYFTRMPGLQDLNYADSLTEVYADDHGNRIYRVDLAPLQDPSPNSDCDKSRT